MLSNLVTIPFIEQNILNDKYSSVLELCAEFTKLFENLKLFLAQGSHYYQACDEMEQYITPYIRSVCQGTFNVIEYIQKNKESNGPSWFHLFFLHICWCFNDINS